VPWLTVGLAILIAGHDLSRARLPRLWLRVSDRWLMPLSVVIDRLHNGVVGDYVTWIVVGLALLSLSFAAIGG
jgi:multicomponent Na+:H+ antiporter subunit D